MAGRKGEKFWRAALRIAVEANDAEGRRKLRMIAEKTVEMALDGDMAAIREIGDRLDGKAHQSTDTHLELDVSDNLKEAMREFRGRIASVSARQRAAKTSE